MAYNKSGYHDRFTPYQMKVINDQELAKKRRENEASYKVKSKEVKFDVKVVSVETMKLTDEIEGGISPVGVRPDGKKTESIN